MNLKYGLGYTTIEGLNNKSTVKIRYTGGFLITNINKNYTFVRVRNIIIATPKKNSNYDNDELLFNYDGDIRILNCIVDKIGIKVIPTDIDIWGKITTKWEDMTLDWEDYLMDLKINTEKKRLTKKRQNKYEL